MKEELVSFETAKLAKEAGFGLTNTHYIQLPNWYDNKGTLKKAVPTVSKIYNSSRGHLGADTVKDFQANYELLDNSLEDVFLAPTQSLLQKWLREIHNIQLYVECGIVFEFRIKGVLKGTPYKKYDTPEYYYNTYEEGLEAGLKHALKLIIDNGRT